MKNKFLLIAAASLSLLWLGLGQPVLSTPTTQIGNPSTDVQAAGTWHLGIDNYFTLASPTDGGYAFPTDLGVTYGVLSGLEIGADAFLPQSSPFVFNAKFALAEGEVLPAVAVGGFGFGTEKGVTDQNVLYGLIAKTFQPIGRLTVGYFRGNSSLLLNPEGQRDNAGVILTWDKAIGDKLWLCVDYASTRSVLGALFFGLSWVFAPNTSVIFGYGTFNNGAKPTLTTQLDINL